MMPTPGITLEAVARCLSQHVRLYGRRSPVYQYVTLTALERQWLGGHGSALDVGGGTGVMAQAVKTLFGLTRVTSVDVQDRFLPSLDIQTSVYDGHNLPFPDDSFDCVLLFNVLHHVPVAARARLITECRRVAGSGPIYIKDHISAGRLDDARLALLDVLGNVPFGGMVKATYLTSQDWVALAASTGHEMGEPLSGAYRSGAFAALFPNRLEASMRWCPTRSA